ncbi:MAG: GTP-binding protein [Deltaproteobacteria bacterium]|nr:MAG: GTP-binding protein [Deltaproteobacteria bacterium]
MSDFSTDLTTNLKFVIVGHIDHGKSTLIGRLLYDTDSLQPDKVEEMRRTSGELGKETEFAFIVDQLREEREQGVTIDTTQIFFRSSFRNYVIIDAPGHIEFIKNMITGASQAEAAVLIIDAAEGIKEQTRRHTYILSLLGISQVIVVFNKMDLVGYDEARYKELKIQAQELIESLNIETDYYIPISALRGDNIVNKAEALSWYQGPTFLKGLDSLEGYLAAADRPLIFPVQDIYKIGSRKVIVGRVEAGNIRAGQVVKILPEDYQATVKSIERFQEERTSAVAQESIGVMLQNSLFVERGMVMCHSDRMPKVTNEFKANVFWMARSPMKKSERITLRCATQSIMVEVPDIYRRINSSSLTIVQEDADDLGSLDVGEVRIKAKKPVVIEKFSDVQELGRFVLMRQNNICAGGIITGWD